MMPEKMAGKSDQQLLAMLASPDDWTPEALDAATAELRKRGVKLRSEPPSSGPPLESDEGPDRPDIFEFFGTYPNSDARVLLDAFVQEGVEFTLNGDKMGAAGMTAAQAAHGGTFGAGVGIAIGVQVEDIERAMEIRQRVFRIFP